MEPMGHFNFVHLRVSLLQAHVFHGVVSLQLLLHERLGTRLEEVTTLNSGPRRSGGQHRGASWLPGVCAKWSQGGSGQVQVAPSIGGGTERKVLFSYATLILI